MEVKLHSCVETRWREVGGVILQPLHQLRRVIQHASVGSLCGSEKNLTQAFVKRSLFCGEIDPCH